MMYENFMTIKMRTEAEAAEALEILRRRLAEGFAVDDAYERNPALEMSNALEVAKTLLFFRKTLAAILPKMQKA